MTPLDAALAYAPEAAAEVPRGHDQAESLDLLAARIRAAHEAALKHQAKTIESAIDAGLLLIEAKRRLHHGEWMKWLTERCEMPGRTARYYMRIAQNRESIRQNGNVANLSLRAAVESIATGVPDDPFDPVDDGSDDAADEPASGPTVSRLGDLWLLGGHRVLCGSVLEIAALQTLMGEERAAMVFTDPPYNVPIDGHAVRGGAIHHHREFAMAVGEMSTPAFAVFLARSLRNLAASCAGGALLYVFMDWRHEAEMLAAGREIDAEQLNLCIWVKDNPGVGSLYRSQHELIFVFKTGSGPHRNNVQLGRFGRNRSNVWHYPGVNSFSRKTEEGNLLALHPTVKPAALVADAILDCTARGEIVLDGFLGSGTTVIAAERTGRRCYGEHLAMLAARAEETAA
jgi:DNA modification methylase